MSRIKPDEMPDFVYAGRPMIIEELKRFFRERRLGVVGIYVDIGNGSLVVESSRSLSRPYLTLLSKKAGVEILWRKIV